MVRRGAGFSDVPVDGAGAGRASGVGAALAFSVVAGVRAGAGDASAVVTLAGEAARLRGAGFVACSWLSGAGVALSVFARVAERVRVVAGFTCSLASGDSDVLLIKKTPFYQMICHDSGLACLKSATRRGK